ncbi:hypothetical protein BCR34DRAFT_667325 [Clohesyomyces aquaticus]|uniref:Protein kinase domain-containing protein n=1 Tax=Clohesyomyces aquaticus TaxID=1231657 RepID=A0A1Y1Z0K6_9PLEO|nr:hypothetical protein BCR34DRAFT_667325 [Clohesyomyces aquaticus]
MALNDIVFTGQRPIVGVGHHFVVYASPFAKLDEIPERVAKVQGELYCIKSPNLERSQDDARFRREYYLTVLQELRVMSHPNLLNHENIIGILGFDFQEDYDDHRLTWPLLFVEYAEFGTLDAFQTDVGRLHPHLARNLLLDIALALEGLHNCNIIHGDVKSENVLVCGHPERQYIAKLCDFGMSVISPPLSEQHYMPGLTWLWSAPEVKQQLTVSGMKQTDVYSFGLTVWRVSSHHPDPFKLLPPMGTSASNDRDFLDQVKTSPNFPNAVIQSLSGLNGFEFATYVIAMTLSPKPNERSLQAVIGSLSSNGFNRAEMSAKAMNSQNLDEQSPQLVMSTLIEAFPRDIAASFQGRPSVIYSLFEDLNEIAFSGAPLAMAANALLFGLIISPAIQLGNKSPGNQLRVLHRACTLGSESHRAIAHLFCVSNQLRSDNILQISWLEDAAWGGSLFARLTLLEYFPEEFKEWTLKIENSATEDSSEKQLLAYCRTGNLSRVHKLLDQGASALSDWDEPGVLHLLATHLDPDIIPLLHRLISAGAELDHWEGNSDDDDLVLGRCHGTPLHWAVLHHNIPLLQQLIELDKQPQVANLERALWIATVMHFADALEMLRDWAISASIRFDPDWLYKLQIIAAAHLEYHLPRRLQHQNKSDIAMSQTFEMLFTMYSPTKAQLISPQGLFNFGLVSNDVAFVRYLVHRFDIPKSIRIPDENKDTLLACSIMCGFVEIFELLYERGIIALSHRTCADKFTGIQGCLAVRQRNPIFVQRYIEWGCWVDELGDTENSEWTPFGMAVQCGLYEVAGLLLRHGANKDAATGWLGGTTPLFRLLHTWPDVPISRVKYLLEELPGQGFGHVSFIGWPANGANILYCFSMAVWSHYRNGYKFGGTMKYILSRLGDRSLINQMDRSGCTALNMAARGGNLEVVRILIEAGADVNGGQAISPLNAAMEWRDKWARAEHEAMQGQVLGEQRHATKIRLRAEELIHLLRVHGARERGFAENQQLMMRSLANGEMKLPSMESRARRGSNTVVSLYGPHQCYPWIPCPFANGNHPPPQNKAPPSRLSILSQNLPSGETSPWGRDASTLVPRPATSPYSSQGHPYHQRMSFHNPSSPSPNYQPPNQGPMTSRWTLPGMPQAQLNSEPYSPPSNVAGSARDSPCESSSQWLPPSTAPAPIPHPREPLFEQPPSQPGRCSESILARLKTKLAFLRQPNNDDLYSMNGVTIPNPLSESTRERVVEILQSEFSQPIVLLYHATGIEQVIDIAIIESVVADFLGSELMRGMELMFVPELEEDGKSLWMHVFHNSVKSSS